MIDYNYRVLYWTKDVIDDLVSGREQRSMEEVLMFLSKVSENISYILHTEESDFDLNQICPN